MKIPDLSKLGKEVSSFFLYLLKVIILNKPLFIRKLK